MKVSVIIVNYNVKYFLKQCLASVFGSERRMNDGSEINGMIYIMKLIRQSPPYADYYRGICGAYRKLGLAAKIRTVLEPALLRSFARDRR